MELLRPVDKAYPVTQLFGENPQNYPFMNGKGHNGVDFGCPPGTPIYAMADGVVVRAELDTQTAQNPRTGYGLHVRIQHGNGWTSVYGHFSELSVKTGAKVKAGDVIGLSGNTGYSTGPHLHAEVRTGASVLTSIDIIGMFVEVVQPTTVILMGEILKDGDLLRVRSGPGTEFPMVKTNTGATRYLHTGDKFEVLGLAGNVWLQIDGGFVKHQNKWIKLTIPDPVEKK